MIILVELLPIELFLDLLLLIELFLDVLLHIAAFLDVLLLIELLHLLFQFFLLLKIMLRWEKPLTFVSGR